MQKVGDLKSIKLNENYMLKYALVKLKLKNTTIQKLYREFQTIIMQTMAQWPLLIKCSEWRRNFTPLPKGT